MDFGLPGDISISRSQRRISSASLEIVLGWFDLSDLVDYNQPGPLKNRFLFSAFVPLFLGSKAEKRNRSFGVQEFIYRPSFFIRVF